jgi:S-DNA-T family DNA segregation ATPase FtsK/SpoIIIE
VSVEEVDAITDFIGDQPGNGPYILPPFDDDEPEMPELGRSDPSEKDELFEEAARIIVRSQQGSVSLLQRKLSIGYTRSARIVDQLEEAGIVGPFEGSKARQVLVGSDQELDAFLGSESS